MKTKEDNSLIQQCKDMDTRLKAQHTPTPWKVGLTVETSSGQKEIQIRSFVDGSSNGLYVGSVWATNGEMADPCEEGKANAAFIVRAVNSHEALLDACKATLLRDDIADDELGDLIREAIAKAEGK